MVIKKIKDIQDKKEHSKKIPKTSLCSSKALSQISQVFLISIKELRSCHPYHNEDAI